MDIHYSYKARDDLVSLPKDIQRRIAKKMRFYSSEKDPLKFAKRLENPAEGEFRFRVGDYRIFFDVTRNKIFVLKIKHRSKCY